jgi:histidinol-phosphate aminotransferase
MEPKVNPKLVHRKPYKIPSSKCDIKLDTNENMFPPHPSLVGFNYHLYPNPELSSQLKSKIAEKHNLSSNQVLLSPGSDMGLKMILEGYALPNTKTLIITPNYSRFTYFIESMFTDYKELQVNENNYLEKINSELLQQTFNLVYVSHPNLPLGYTFSIQQISDLLNGFPQTMFIVDEAYLEYSEAESTIGLTHQYNNLIVVKTFSKAFGLAGLRLGYMMSNEKVISLLSVLSNDKSITNQSMHAAITCLDHLDHYQQQIQELKKVRSWFCSQLDRLEIGWKCSTTNFVLVELDPSWKNILLSHGIGVKIDYQNWLRITIGTQSMMTLLVHVIEKHLQQKCLECN